MIHECKCACKEQFPETPMLTGGWIMSNMTYKEKAVQPSLKAKVKAMPRLLHPNGLQPTDEDIADWKAAFNTFDR